MLATVPRLQKIRSKRAERRLLSIILKAPLPNALHHLSHIPPQARQTATLQVQPLSETSSLVKGAAPVAERARSRVLERIIHILDKQKQAISFLKANGMNCGWPRDVTILEEINRCRNGCLIGRMISKVQGSFIFLLGNSVDPLHAHQRGDIGLG